MQAHGDLQKPVKKRSFNLQEAVILLDVYLDMVKNESTLDEAAEKASFRLRDLAKKGGYVFGADYRNAGELAGYLRNLGYIYAGRGRGTWIFVEAIFLYKNNRARFEEILRTAESVTSQEQEQDEVQDERKADTSGDSEALPEPVEVQPDWIKYDFTNAQAFAGTVPVYCAVDGVTVEVKSWARLLVGVTELALDKHGAKMAPLYDETLTGKKDARPFLMREQPENTERTQLAKLSNGHWVCTKHDIPRIMGIISAVCKRCGYTKEQVVIYGAPNSAKTLPVKKNAVTVSTVPTEEFGEYLRAAGLRGATAKELVANVRPAAAVSSVVAALNADLNVVAMPGNRFVHVDAFVDLDEAAETLGKILKDDFARFGGYSNNHLLFGAASKELSMFLNDNGCETIDAVYAVARFLFEKKKVAGTPYKFYSPHIFETEPDFPMNVAGLVIRLARDNDGILYLSRAEDFLRKTELAFRTVGSLLQIGTSDTFLVYDADCYILRESLGADEAWSRRMHDRLDDLFRKANVAYVIPRDLTDAWLKTLPPLPQGLEWTRLLLQEVLDKCPAVGFKSISPSMKRQSYDAMAAAFVPVDSPLQNFPDVVTLFMQERHKLPWHMSGEELRKELREAGMIENKELAYSLHKALNDYRFAWTDGNRNVMVRGNG